MTNDRDAWLKAEQDRALNVSSQPALPVSLPVLEAVADEFGSAEAHNVAKRTLRAAGMPPEALSPKQQRIDAVMAHFGFSEADSNPDVLEDAEHLLALMNGRASAEQNLGFAKRLASLIKPSRRDLSPAKRLKLYREIMSIKAFQEGVERDGAMAIWSTIAERLERAKNWPARREAILAEREATNKQRALRGQPPIEFGKRILMGCEWPEDALRLTREDRIKIARVLGYTVKECALCDQATALVEEYWRERDEATRRTTAQLDTTKGGW